MKKSTSITINIDLTDEFEVSLLNFVNSKGKKSRYLKRLIHDDMTGVRKQVAATFIEEQEEENEEMGGFF